MNHEAVGGALGYWFRRAIHISMVFIPYLYYWYGEGIATFIGLTPDQILSLIIICILLIEALRLRFGWLLIGQRHYELEQFSAFTWGAVSLAIVLIFAPHIGYKNAGFGFPLIASLALGDPVLGEARRFGLSTFWIYFLGTIVIGCIWLLSVFLLQTPLWAVPFVVPLTLLAELPKWRWIDDNATMLIIPLAFILFIQLFI